MLWPKQGGAGRAIKNDHAGAFNDMARLMQWSGVEWSGVEWSGVEWSGVEFKHA
jgi:hypothetical protein